MKILRIFNVFVSPKHFYHKTKFWIFLFGVGALIGIGYGVVGGLFFSPADYQQGDAFRIIYVHVPSSFLSMAVYVLISLFSINFLIFKIKLMDVFSKVSVPIGVAFTFLALVTGMIWGKPMWGTWWVWDARLTSELILLFLYFGLMGLRTAIPYPLQASKMCAILSIVGLINIPIIHYSVSWWHTLHQGPTLSKFSSPSIANEMLYPLLFMIFGFACFYVALMFYKARGELLLRDKNTSWVREVLCSQTI